MGQNILCKTKGWMEGIIALINEDYIRLALTMETKCTRHNT